MGDVVIKHGNIFNSKAEALVNPVNTVGVMGKGLAWQFKRLYPEMFKAYKEVCDLDVLRVGGVHLWGDEERTIINFPTKADWRSPSRLNWIKHGLYSLVNACRREKIKTIALPALGCGEGGLDFDHDVYPLIIEMLGDSGISAEVYLL